MLHKQKLPSVTTQEAKKRSDTDIIASESKSTIEEISPSVESTINSLDEKIDADFTNMSDKIESNFEKMFDSIISIQRTSDIILDSISEKNKKTTSEYGTLEDARRRLGQLPPKEEKELSSSKEITVEIKDAVDPLNLKIDKLQDFIEEKDEELKSYIDQNFDVKEKQGETTEAEATAEQQQREDYARLYEFLKDRFPLLADEDLNKMIKNHYKDSEGLGGGNNKELSELNKNLEKLEAQKKKLAFGKKGIDLISSLPDLISGNLGNLLIAGYLGHILTSKNWESFRSVAGLPKNDDEWKKFALDTGTVVSKMMDALHKEWNWTKIINGPFLVTAGLLTGNLSMIGAGGLLVASDVERAKKEQPTSPVRSAISKGAYDVLDYLGVKTTIEQVRGTLDPFANVLSFNLKNIPQAIFRDTSELEKAETKTGFDKKGLYKLFESFIKKPQLTTEEIMNKKTSPQDIAAAINEYNERSQHKDFQSDETIKSMQDLQKTIQDRTSVGKPFNEEELGELFLNWSRSHKSDPWVDYQARANNAAIKSEAIRAKARTPEAVYSKFIVPFMSKSDASTEEKQIIKQMQDIENDSSLSRQDKIKKIYDIYYKNIYPGKEKRNIVTSQDHHKNLIKDWAYSVQIGLASIDGSIGETVPEKYRDEVQKLLKSQSPRPVKSEQGKKVKALSSLSAVETQADVSQEYSTPTIQQSIVNNDNRGTTITRPFYPMPNTHYDAWFRYITGASSSFDIQKSGVPS